ncbi:FtsX-like permease family protein [Halopseudomonas yangmingensis]|uniref:Putative ABC transport system permease protein n=1 Tax=Halopseudomonas yangmingensis TaxID=1720063 RepID=A0A1I4P733_9GAMM|nr:FtsX-like permease family protein [Halopseudomonas yangmingensis]SFM23601.1 putative ABC transport system permease protein [Halopseudomonas yangmingensis]
MKSWPEHIGLLGRLALLDLWHDRKVSFCIAASLVAVIAPLLLLFGLKNGIVSQLRSDLLDDPRNLEIRMLSSGNYDSAWIDQLRQRPEVGFAIGQTRSLNTLADLQHGRRFVENAEILPSAEGDPLLGRLARQLNEHQLILSAQAAERLQASTGDNIRLQVMRRLNDSNEQAQLLLQVVEVLEAARFARAAAFVAPATLQQLEHYRDGYLVTQLGGNTGAPLVAAVPQYARARLYARSIEQVAPLERWLNQQHIETSSRLADIEQVRAISHVLGVIFTVIAAAALAGCIASLTGALLANIDRKRGNIAILRLLGFKAPSIAGYLVLQALLLGMLGYLGGLALYLLAARLFDRLLGSTSATGEFICTIEPWHGIAALLLSLAVAAGVSVTGALRAIRIQPAESLREL